MSGALEHAGTAMPQSETATFNFGTFPVRIQIINNEPWFVAKDVLSALGYADSSNPARVIQTIPDEWRGVNRIHTPGGDQDMLMISEQGLYFFLGRSDKSAALPFQKKVAGEILPSIRKHGGYIATTGEETVEELSLRAMTALQAAVERQKAQIAEQRTQLMIQAPAVEYCNEVLAAENLHTVNSIATHLGVSAIRLNQFLLNEGFIYRQGDIYQPGFRIRGKKYCDFHIVPYLNSQGEKMTREHLKWTEAGRRAVIELWNVRHNEARKVQ